MADPPAERPARVAVIEDDLPTREVFVEVLNDAGYLVDAWDGREDLLSFINRIDVDVIVQDVRLGSDLSIWELLDHIDALRPAVTPRVLLCSADNAFLRTHRKELDDRSCAIVEKPFALDAFLEAVAECVEVATPYERFCT